MRTTVADLELAVGWYDGHGSCLRWASGRASGNAEEGRERLVPRVGQGGAER